MEMAFCLNVNYCLLPTLNTWHPFWVLACPGARSGGLGPGVGSARLGQPWEVQGRVWGKFSVLRGSLRSSRLEIKSPRPPPPFPSPNVPRGAAAGSRRV